MERCVQIYIALTGAHQSLICLINTSFNTKKLFRISRVYSNRYPHIAASCLTSWDAIIIEIFETFRSSSTNNNENLSNVSWGNVFIEEKNRYTNEFHSGISLGIYPVNYAHLNQDRVCCFFPLVTCDTRHRNAYASLRTLSARVHTEELRCCLRVCCARQARMNRQIALP